MQRVPAPLLDQPGNLACGIVQVAEVTGHGGAIGNAGRLLSHNDPIAAKVALHYDSGLMVLRAHFFIRSRPIPREVVPLLIVVIALSIGTRHHARPAADAFFGVDIDSAVRPLETRLGRTDFNARGLSAMKAQDGKKELADGWVVSLFLFKQAGEEDSGRGAMLGLT